MKIINNSQNVYTNPTILSTTFLMFYLMFKYKVGRMLTRKWDSSFQMCSAMQFIYKNFSIWILENVSWNRLFMILKHQYMPINYFCQYINIAHFCETILKCQSLYWFNIIFIDIVCIQHKILMFCNTKRRF